VVNAKKGEKQTGDWYVTPAGIVWVKEKEPGTSGTAPTDAIQKINGSTAVDRVVGDAKGFEDPSRVLLYFGLTMIENLGIDVGFAYTFPLTSEASIKYTYPIYAGLGASYTMGQFGVKARVQGTFMGSQIGDWSGAKKSEDGVVVLFDVLPSYAVSDNLTAYLAAGIQYNGVGKYDGEKPKHSNGDEVKAEIGWHIDPYLAYSVGPGTFYAGINLSSDGKRISGKPDEKTGEGKTYINWAVPIGLAFSF